MKTTLQTILRSGFDDYCAGRRLRLAVHKMARSVMACRTAALGGHVHRCPQGHVQRVWYNSCKHRTCPQCSQLSTERWLQRRCQRLLECDHFHVVFTIPNELLDVWRYNRAWLNDQLYRCSRDTLMELLASGKYLGATPGMILSLHTWGRTLIQHPHIHCLVTGGGWDGQNWRGVRNGFLVPTKVAQALFRGKLLAAIRVQQASGELELPESPLEFRRQLRKLSRTKWNVRVKERYAHGSGVLTYLARYLRGGPISDRRLLRSDGQTVTFRYRAHRDGRHKTMQLSRQEFLSRLFEHVPEPGVHGARYYGLYASNKRDLLDRCRELLGQAPTEEPEYLTYEVYLEQRGLDRLLRCPVCNRRLERFELADTHGRSPPYRALKRA